MKASAILLASMAVTLGLVAICSLQSSKHSFRVLPNDYQDITVTVGRDILVKDGDHVLYSGYDTTEAVNAALANIQDGATFKQGEHSEHEETVHGARCAMWQQVEGCEWDSLHNAFLYY